MRPIFAALALVATAANVSFPALAKVAPAADTSERIVLKRADDGRYCTPARAVTGSIIPHRVCKTRADWIADGIHIERPAS